VDECNVKISKSKKSKNDKADEEVTNMLVYLERILDSNEENLFVNAIVDFVYNFDMRLIRFIK